MAARHWLMIGLGLLTSGCLGSADTKKADDATTLFYQRLAAKQYDAIYNDSATDLKTVTSEADFIALMQRVDTTMGACQPPVKRFDIHTNFDQSAFFRNQGYTQTCANGPLYENVTIVIRNGEAKLAAYAFSSRPPAVSADSSASDSSAASSASSDSSSAAPSSN